MHDNRINLHGNCMKPKAGIFHNAVIIVSNIEKIPII